MCYMLITQHKLNYLMRCLIPWLLYIHFIHYKHIFECNHMSSNTLTINGMKMSFLYTWCRIRICLQPLIQSQLISSILQCKACRQLACIFIYKPIISVTRARLRFTRPYTRSPWQLAHLKNRCRIIFIVLIKKTKLGLLL